MLINYSNKKNKNKIKNKVNQINNQFYYLLWEGKLFYYITFFHYL